MQRSKQSEGLFISTYLTLGRCTTADYGPGVEKGLCRHDSRRSSGAVCRVGGTAAITTTGNVTPATDPLTWRSGYTNQAGTTKAYIGNTADGGLTINGGSAVNSSIAYLGYTAGMTGTVTVDGPGSSWVNQYGQLYVGYKGTGALSIINGSTVTTATSYVGYAAGASGTAIVDGCGSTWANTYLRIGNTGTGLLSITNGGTVVTNDPSNDAVIGAASSGNGTVLVDGTGSGWTMSSRLNIGSNGIGSLNITQIGLYSGSNGTASVDGTGSTFTMSDTLAMGFNYDGTSTSKLSITNGGTVNGTTAWMGYTSWTNSTAIVNGSGSTWKNSGTLEVGSSGAAKLSISDGGAVTASTVSINNLSTLTTDVGRGSSVTVGTGTITNNGTIRMVAAATAANGTYTPISAAWDSAGTGTIQALGGKWDSTAHTVTVADAARVAAGSAAAIDLATNQRVFFTDSSTGRSVGAGFVGTDTSTPLIFTASAITGSTLGNLLGLITEADKGVLSAWDFSTTGYTVDATHPVYLSLFADSATGLSDLSIWHFDGTNWGKYDAFDLAFDGTYASFTAESLSGYAVTGTAPVPIPGALFLLAPGLAGLAFVRRRIFSA